MAEYLEILILNRYFIVGFVLFGFFFNQVIGLLKCNSREKDYLQFCFSSMLTEILVVKLLTDLLKFGLYGVQQ